MLDQVCLVSTTYDGQISKIYINGSLTGTTAVSGPISYGSSNRFYVGASPVGEYLNGDIAEILVYDHALSESEMAKVGIYLNGKYSIPGISSPSAPTAVQAVAVSSTQINVTWNQGLTNGGRVTYSVERKTGSGDYIKITESDSDLSYFDSDLSPNTTYTYRIAAHNYAGISAGVESAPVTTYLDSAGTLPLTGLKLWLKADRGIIANSSGSVSTWLDQSGSGNDVIQLNSGNQPTFEANVVNGRPVVRLNGSSQYLAGAAAAAFQPTNITIMAVYRAAGRTPGNYSRIISQPYSPGWTDPWASWLLTASNPTGEVTANLSVDGILSSVSSTKQMLEKVCLVSATYDGQSGNIYINGKLTGTTAVSGSISYGTPSPFYVGASPIGEYLNGDIAEILVYDHALSQSELGKVSGYLDGKYSITNPTGHDTGGGAGPNSTMPYAVCDAVTQTGSTLTASGWALDEEDGAPIAKVEAFIDGKSYGTATLGYSRSDAAANAVNGLGYPGPSSRYDLCGWVFNCSIDGLSGASHSIHFVAYDSQGGTTTFGSQAFSQQSPYPWCDSVTVNGSTLTASGWALDKEDGAPIAKVEVFVDGKSFGNASLGHSRLDVANFAVSNLGFPGPSSRYDNCGWQFSASVAALSAGAHSIRFTAHDSQGGTTDFGSQTFTLEPPFAWCDSVTVNGSTLSASGWAVDKEDGAPIAKVEVFIDGNSYGNADLGFLRTDVADYMVKNLGYPGPASRYNNCGWQFNSNIADLGTGSHSIRFVAHDNQDATSEFGARSFIVGGGTGDNPTMPVANCDAVTISGTSLTASGWALDKEDGAPISKVQVFIDGYTAGNATLGYSRGDAANHAVNDLGYPGPSSRYDSSGWVFTTDLTGLIPGAHTISFVANDNQGGQSTFGAQSFTVVASGPSGGSGGATLHPTVAARVAVMAKGVGTVRLSIDGQTVEYIFNRADGNFDVPVGATTGLDRIGPYFVADDTNYPVTVSSHGVTDYVVAPSIDTTADPFAQRRIYINDRFLDAINKSEVEAGSGSFYFKPVRTASLPFGIVDLSKFETARMIYFGLGTNNAGVPAGLINFDLSSYLYDLATYSVPPPNITLNSGPGLLERTESKNAFQARSSSGIVDVQRSSTSITVRFFKDAAYTKTNGIYDFGNTSPLIEYDIALSQPSDVYTCSDVNEIWRTASQFALTRKVGTEQRVFEARTDYFAYDGPEHEQSPDGSTQRWLRSYDACVRVWPWQTPGASHQNLVELTYHAKQDMVRIPGSQIVPQTLVDIRLVKRNFSGPDRTSTVMHCEVADYNPDDRWLLSSPGNDYIGSITGDITFVRGEGVSRLNNINGWITALPTGGKSFCEFYRFWNPVDGANLGTQPVSAVGKPKTVRTSFLDGTVGDATDLVTTNTYTLALNNTKTLLESTETVQGTTKIGKRVYSYATSTLNAMEVLETTEDSFVKTGESLRTVTKAYSSRAIDRDFSDKPLSILHPDQTKVSYAYQRGDLSGSTWTANATGRYLLVAELSGKDGTSVTAYRGVDLDPLDMDATKSTVSERIVDPFGHVIRECSYVYTANGSFSLLTSTYYGYDDFGNLIAKSDQPIGGSGRVLYQADFTGFRKNWEVDEQGIKLSYTYDDYERVATMTRESAGSAAASNYIAAVTTTHAYDEIGRLKSETMSASGETDKLVTSYTYDTASRLKTKTVPGGLTTSTTYNSATITTTVLPGGGQQVSELYRDGRPKSTTGSAVTQTSSSYSYDALGFFTVESTLTATGKKATSYSDWAGRVVRTDTAGGGGGIRTSLNTYNTFGQLVAQDEVIGATKLTPTHLFEYDSYGRLVRDGLHVGAGSAIDLSLDIGVKEQNAFFEKKQIKRIDDGTGVTTQAQWYLHTTSTLYPYGGTNASKPKLASETFTQLSGLSDSLAAHTLSADSDRNWTQTFESITPSTKTRVVSTLTTGCDHSVTSTYTNGLLTRSTNAQGHITLQTYDSLGRLEGVDDPRIGLTSYAYVANSSLVKTITSPDLTTTTYEYNDAGRKSAQYNTAGKAARYQYDVKGNLTHTWGDTVNPVKFVYNDLGQKTEMHTYRSGDWSGATLPSDFSGNGDTTTWNYQNDTGLLESKVDNAGGKTSYLYDNLDRTTKRTDARGWVTNYTYFAATHPSGGKLDTVSYVDGSGTPTPTPSVSYTYHRSGAIKTVSDAAGTRSFDYYETWTSDDVDTELRNKSGHLKSEYLSGFFSLAYDYQYAVSGKRNGEISSLQFGNAYTVTYGYDSSLRLSTVSYNTVTPFTYTYVTNSNLIDTVAQMTSSSTYNYRGHFDYESNSNRVSGMTQGWGTSATAQLTSVIGYNELGLRISEKIRGQDWSALLPQSTGGLQSAYGYNDRYEINSAAKYPVNSDWTLGALLGDTARSYEYDRAGNRTSDQFGTYTANGLNQYDYISTAAQKMTYDENGNLTKDEKARYYYDGENRLIRVDLGGTRGVFDYVYDYLGRRISKSVNGAVTSKFVYDGWNLIVELNGSSGVVRKHVWGLGSAGSSQGGGGILLTDTGNSILYPTYDASHNVIGVFNDSGSVAGAWQYDPYGNLISYGGSYGSVYPFLHATKYYDADTGFYYYGMRYYSPNVGRFLHRDPSGETGGINLYGFDRNNPIQNLDAIGLDAKSDEEMQKEEQNRDAKRKSDEDWARQQEMNRADGSVTRYIANGIADSVEGYNSISQDVEAKHEIENRNSGGYKPSGWFGNTKITYDNYGDSTGDEARGAECGPPLLPYDPVVENDRPFGSGEDDLYAGLIVGKVAGDAAGWALGKVGSFASQTRAGAWLIAKAEAVISSVTSRWAKKAASAESAAGIHPGAAAAASADLSQASILRALRTNGSPEALATAKLISRGRLNLKIAPTDPLGQGAAGRYFFGTRIITIAADAAGDTMSAAGFTAHEVRHFLQGITSITYRRVHEFDAYLWQRAADQSFNLSDSAIWLHIRSHPVYLNVPE